MIAFLRIVLALGLVAVAAYGLWEVRRWGTPSGKETVSLRQRGYRSGGLILLLLILALWLHGTYLSTPHTPQATEQALLYWCSIAFLCLPLLALALLDARENIHRALQERRRLRETLFSRSGRSHEE